LLKRKENVAKRLGLTLPCDGVRSGCRRSGRSDGKVSEFFLVVFRMHWCCGRFLVFEFLVLLCDRLVLCLWFRISVVLCLWWRVLSKFTNTLKGYKINKLIKK